MVNQQQKSVIVTHIVNPHHFYFKYFTECVGNLQFTKLDAEIQEYGNDLHLNQSYPKGYTPNEDELIIFFHVIFNKWVRGRVISVGENIKLWCIDNGTFEKSSIQLILPLKTKYHVNLHLVHLGGLSLLPAEKKFNCVNASIEMQPTNKWNCESISTFKLILNNAKMVNFTFEVGVSDHQFGLLKVESYNGKRFIVNDTFLEMSNTMQTDRFVQDISNYVGKSRLQAELYKSVDDAAPLTAINCINNNHSPSTVINRNHSTSSAVSNNDSLSTVTNNDHSLSKVINNNHSPSKAINNNHSPSKAINNNHSPSESAKNNYLSLTGVNNNHSAIINNNHATDSNLSLESDRKISSSWANQSVDSESEEKASSWVNESVDSEPEREVSSRLKQPVDSECNDFDDSVSMVLSSLEESTESSPPPTNHPNIKHLQNIVFEPKIPTTQNYETDSDYECHLRLCSVIRSGCKGRLPLQSTIDWIKSQGKLNNLELPENVFDETQSKASSIINLNDNASSIVSLNDNASSIVSLNDISTLRSTSSASSSLSNVSSTTRNCDRKMMIRLASKSAKNKNVENREKSSGLYGVLRSLCDTQSNMGNGDNKIVNKSSRLNAIPAGYQLNRLETFGGPSKW